MGTLIGMAIPLDIKIIGQLADHTYVKCGTGKMTWKCWGRNDGGANIAAGTASTIQANDIAVQNNTVSNESAGLQCYLINGVCHQAANRILIHAGVTIKKAKGYWISSALFGTYGKVGFGPCDSPFDKFSSVSGDLSECVDSSVSAEEAPEEAKLEKQYLKEVVELYDKAESAMRVKGAEAMDPKEANAFQMELFEHMAKFRLGSELDDTLSKSLLEVREKVEGVIVENEISFKNEEKDVHEFINTFNKMTIQFQDEMAGIMNDKNYQALFDQKRESVNHVLLSDPDILAEVYDIDIKKLT
jgi:hypothetical protein